MHTSFLTIDMDELKPKGEDKEKSNNDRFIKGRQVVENVEKDLKEFRNTKDMWTTIILALTNVLMNTPSELKLERVGQMLQEIGQELEMAVKCFKMQERNICMVQSKLNTLKQEGHELEGFSPEWLQRAEEYTEEWEKYNRDVLSTTCSLTSDELERAGVLLGAESRRMSQD